MAYLIWKCFKRSLLSCDLVHLSRENWARLLALALSLSLNLSQRLGPSPKPKP